MLPFLAVMLQLSANVAGDYWLVVVLRQGVAGAAWATVFSQLLGTSMLIVALQSTAKVALLFWACAMLHVGTWVRYVAALMTLTLPASPSIVEQAVQLCKHQMKHFQSV